MEHDATTERVKVWDGALHAWAALSVPVVASKFTGNNMDVTKGAAQAYMAPTALGSQYWPYLIIHLLDGFHALAVHVEDLQEGLVDTLVIGKAALYTQNK